MKEFGVDRYINKLSKVFPEVEVESIKEVIKRGNKIFGMMKRGSTVEFSAFGRPLNYKDKVLDFYMFYSEIPVWVQNKFAAIQRKKDKLKENNKKDNGKQ